MRVEGVLKEIQTGLQPNMMLVYFRYPILIAVVEIVVGPFCQCFALGVWVRNVVCCRQDLLGVYECHDDDFPSVCVNT